MKFRDVEEENNICTCIVITLFSKVFLVDCGECVITIGMMLH
jgi:hypothetical protein